MIREGKLHCQPDPKADPFLRQAQNIFDGGSKWGASHLTSIAELSRLSSRKRQCSQLGRLISRVLCAHSLHRRAPSPAVMMMKGRRFPRSAHLEASFSWLDRFMLKLGLPLSDPVEDEKDSKLKKANRHCIPHGERFESGRKRNDFWLKIWYGNQE